MTNKKETLFQRLLKDRKLKSDKIVFSSESSNKMKIIILAIGYLIVAFFFSLHLDTDSNMNKDYRLIEGMVWEDPPLIAEFSYPIYKSQEDYINERNNASANALSVFLYENHIKNSNLKLIQSLMNYIINEPQKLSEYGISEKLYRPILELSASARDNAVNSLRNFLTNYVESSYNNGFVNVSTDRISKNEIIVQYKPNQRLILQNEGLTDKTKFIERAEERISKSLIPLLHPLALEILNRVNQPDLVFSKELTDKNMIQASNSVSKTVGIVRQGEIIIQNGEKLTNQNIQKIISYQSARYITSDTTLGLAYYLGSFGHAGIVMSILYIFLNVLRKRIVNDRVQLTIIILMIVATSVLAWLSINLKYAYPIEYLIFIPSFSMLAAIVFDSRTAFVLTVTLALIVAGIRHNDYLTGTTMIFSGTIAAYTVRDIQSRTQVYQSIFFIFLAYSLSVLIFSAEKTLNTDKIINYLIVAVIGAITSPLITFGMLFVIERTTNIASDLRIKEYDKLDHPLLLKLSENAPGTYQHTMSVAMLAERCAREINANPLLTKVGTYFHDIGKMVKPEYFTENQIGIENKHDQISPKKSAKIIIDHVTEGIHLAKLNKLPQRIIDFIPMHHGESLVKHFYAKALEETKEVAVNEADFRYPGPKPNSKETAILMICDSAEAISRIESKSLEEIEKIIDKNIKDRINDGQLDDSNISLDDLNKIKKVIAKTLLGMTHKRVSYKEIPKSPNG